MVVPQNALEEVGSLGGRPNWTEGWSTTNREAGSCRTSTSSSCVVSRGYHMEHICITVATFTVHFTYTHCKVTYVERHCHHFKWDTVERGVGCVPCGRESHDNR